MDIGVVGSSYMEFTIPSSFAKSALYYCPQFGHFYCEDGYYIERPHLDLFLLVYICEGTLYVETRDKSYEAVKDQIVFLDCRYPHKYYCTDSAEFLWFHFKGCSSIQYASLLFEKFGVVFAGEHIVDQKRFFERILSESQAAVTNEHMISIQVSHILGNLSELQLHTAIVNQLISPAIRYIGLHYENEIELEELAEACCISVSHLIRSFKRYMDCTPHEYLLAYRLRQSKKILCTTEHSIEQIAAECGFNSASHYTRAFRKENKITPSEFRTILF